MGSIFDRFNETLTHILIIYWTKLGIYRHMVTSFQTVFLENLEFSVVTKRRNSGSDGNTEYPQEFFL
jgi:hypothetical protein